jgi:hypothetical protein
VVIGPPVDTFAGAGGEANAHRFDVKGYPFLARKPDCESAPDQEAEDSNDDQ